MKAVIHINEETNSNKPVEFTHYLNGSNGWTLTGRGPSKNNKVFYLGKCKTNGDMFMDADSYGTICIFKGYLNSGKY